MATMLNARERCNFCLGAGADITPAVITELNALVPSVGITPPAGWQPGQAQGAAAAPAPATPAQAPKSR